MARAGLTTERVVGAGAELADEVGFDGVTLSRLARRFGVQVASLYSHVRDAHDLKSRIALRALDELADHAAAELAGRSGREAVAALGNAYRSYSREHPGRYAAARFPLDVETALASAGPRHTELTRAVLRGYHLPETEATHAVRLLGSAFHGYIALDEAGAFSHSAPDSDESWERAIDALDSMLRNWPAA